MKQEKKKKMIQQY